MILVDVDHLKAYVDAFGQAAGDAVLCAVARQLVALASFTDLAAWHAGEERRPGPASVLTPRASNRRDRPVA